MARPLEFNRSQATNQALVLFWRKGYQASSLADLLAAMGIARSSFYAAFTDKRTLDDPGLAPDFHPPPLGIVDQEEMRLGPLGQIALGDVLPVTGEIGKTDRLRIEHM